MRFSVNVVLPSSIYAAIATKRLWEGRWQEVDALLDSAVQRCHGFLHFISLEKDGVKTSIGKVPLCLLCRTNRIERATKSDVKEFQYNLAFRSIIRRRAVHLSRFKWTERIRSLIYISCCRLGELKSIYHKRTFLLTMCVIRSFKTTRQYLQTAPLSPAGDLAGFSSQLMAQLASK
jgi:hypothetical protein